MSTRCEHQDGDVYRGLHLGGYIQEQEGRYGRFERACRGSDGQDEKAKAYQEARRGKLRLGGYRRGWGERAINAEKASQDELQGCYSFQSETRDAEEVHDSNAEAYRYEETA